MTVLPAHKYGDPLRVLIAKENAVENRIKGCKGCAHLSYDASGERIFATCDRSRKVGRARWRVAGVSSNLGEQRG